MSELGQELNAGQSPLTGSTSNPTNIVLLVSGQQIIYLTMMPMSLFSVKFRVDVFVIVSCFPNSALMQANEIACLGQLNGSHLNLPSRCEVTKCSRLRSSGLTIEVPDEWTVVMR